ncbi:hypothetical protein ABDK00_016725 [Niabella insulamsoli]|uniref:hypothetical protein n=1 Tax=Niabella insulamsoli TaxID=3144874 RepID=UPI0031FD4CC2
MTVKLMLAAFFITLIMGCNKADNASPIDDPTEQIAWLKSKKEELSKNCGCMPTIWSHSYEGRTIFEIGCSGPACNCVHSFYEENGNEVAGAQDADRASFVSKLKNQKKLWSCGE